MNGLEIAVIAKSRVQFDYFVGSIHHKDRGAYHCVTRKSDARGTKFSAVIRVGQFWENRAHDELYAYIRHSIQARAEGES